MDNGIIVLNLVESNNPHNKPIIAQDFSNGTCLTQIKFMTEQQIKKLAKRSLLTEASYQKAGAINNRHKVGSINSIFYFLHKAAEPFNCLEQDNLA